MSTVVFRRPPRRPGPAMPAGELTPQEPPTLPEPQGGNLSAALMYLPMAAGSSASVLVFMQPGTGPATYLSSGMMAVSTLGMLAGQLGRGTGDRRRRLRGERHDYLRHLAQLRRQVRRDLARQQQALHWRHPDPAGLWSVAMSARLWERRAGHEDFAEVRLALGTQRLATRILAPKSKPVEDLEPVAASALRRFTRAYSTVADVPMSVYLPGYARLLVQGEPDAAAGLGRALLAQLAALHSPEDLRIAVCAAPDRLADWDWVKWLPHALHPTAQDGAGPLRLVGDDYAELEHLLGADGLAARGRFEANSPPAPDEPYTIVVLDGVSPPDGSRAAGAGYRNALVLDLSGALPWRGDARTLRLRVDGDLVESVSTDRSGQDVGQPIGRPDALGVPACALLARQLAPHRLGGPVEVSDALSVDFDLGTLLGVADARDHDVRRLWAEWGQHNRLRVPIGMTEQGSPVELDIRESAQGGMGPHGMLIGATGSGKSELLRTLVLAMAATHSSEILNFVLVDFKGGATFLGLDALPHTSAVITNLSDQLDLVARMRDALQGELVRRQELLRTAGNYTSVLDYERARAAGAPLAPLPTLFVVVDEFSELLATVRDMIDLFIMIGRLGRSLGVHLLLASQRLDEGRIHQLESHLSYRIALRTFSAAESRSVLGVGDAYELPGAPGNGLLRCGTEPLIRFKAAYVSGPYRMLDRGSRRAVVERSVVAYDTAYQVHRAPPAAPEPAPAEGSLLSVLADRLRGAGPAAHQVWLPPLGAPPTLDGLLPGLAVEPGLGLRAADQGTLRVPVGVIDRPFAQRRDLLVADLAEGAGHVAIVGAPRSGKSTLVRTLLLGLALTHSPREVQFYCLDFGGSTLTSMAGLPHTGGVATRLDTDKVTRTMAELAQLLAAREQLFQAAGVESMAEYRTRRAAGEFADDPHGDVFLVVDGWFTLHQEFETLEPAIGTLAARGLAFGIHLVITAARWTEVRPWLRDLIGTRFELRLGEPLESEINARAAATVPTVAGRGLTGEELHFLTALPRADGVESAEDLATATRALVEDIAAEWTGPTAPPIRLLPALLPADDLPAPDGDLRVALGWDEATMSPLRHDFGSAPHLIVVGDSESGKTNLLRLTARAVSRRFTPQEARVLVADPRRTLYDAVPASHLLRYTVTGLALAEAVQEALPSLRKRMPGADIDPARLRRKDWWQGPRLFLLIDDYDLLSGATENPLAPLLPLLPHGAEIGLHVVVARGAAGAARGMMDPVLRRLWDLNSPGLLLSCGRDEGVFLGDTMPRRLPPGRGQFVDRRSGAVLLQTGYVD